MSYGDVPETRRSQQTFGGAMQSTMSMAGGGGAAGVGPTGRPFDPSDYIEISQPDHVFLCQWSCVPIRCTLAEADRKPLEKSHAHRNSQRSTFGMRGPDGGDRGGLTHSHYCVEYIVPRQSFLFMHCGTILNGFKNVVAREGFPWLSYRLDDHTRVPLPWQYPVSVVVDMIRMKRRVAASNNNSNSTSSNNPFAMGPEDRLYPFEVTLHLSEPPVASVSDPLYSAYLKTLRVNDLKSGLLFLKQLMKRSTCYTFGSTIPLLELEVNHPDYFTDLFEGIQENDPEKFWRGKCGLRYYGELEREEEAGAGEPMYSMINLGPTPTSSAAATTAAIKASLLTSPQGGMGVPTFTDPNATEGTANTTSSSAAYLRQQMLAYPIVLHCEGTTKTVRWRQNGQKLGQFLKEHVPWLDFLSREDIFHRHEPAPFVLIQGLSPFLSSPVEDLYELLASPDLCLHIVVRPMFVKAQEPAPPKK